MSASRCLDPCTMGLSKRARVFAGLCLALLAAACDEQAKPLPPPPPPPAAPAVKPEGLTRVLGLRASEAIALLGQTTLDRTEGRGRQLQFAREVCVLDLFLYPPSTGAEPRVKYVYARKRDGSPFDAAACLDAQLLARAPPS